MKFLYLILWIISLIFAVLVAVHLIGLNVNAPPKEPRLITQVEYQVPDNVIYYSDYPSYAYYGAGSVGGYYPYRRWGGGWRGRHYWGGGGGRRWGGGGGRRR